MLDCEMVKVRLYLKHTDKHQFLRYTSSHPDHTKNSKVSSQALMVSRICFEKSDFLKNLEKMNYFSWFLVREYQLDLIETEMKKSQVYFRT